MTNQLPTQARVVIIGGGSVGAETAKFLLDHKKDVTLVEMLPHIAADTEEINRKVLLRSLGEIGAQIRVLTKVTGILPGGVEMEFGGRKEILPVDTVVLAVGTRANDELEAILREESLEFYKIGDCATPRKAIDAIHEGFKAGLRI